MLTHYHQVATDKDKDKDGLYNTIFSYLLLLVFSLTLHLDPFIFNCQPGFQRPSQQLQPTGFSDQETSSKGKGTPR